MEETNKSSDYWKEKLPPYTLPLSVARFLAEPDDVEWQTDHDYFQSLLAIESARSLTHRVGRSVTYCVFNISQPNVDYFASPTSDLSSRGKEMETLLKELTDKLDAKRSVKLQGMSRRPVVEQFLDAMKATELERKIFRFIFVKASNLNESCDFCQQLQRQIDWRGPGVLNSVSVSFRVVSDVFEEVSLAKLMSLADAQSIWVKEQIYKKVSSPLEHVSAMEEATMRALCGFDLTPSQFQSIGSVLQKVLLEDENFRRSKTGKAIVLQKDRENSKVSNGDPKDKSSPASDFIEAWQAKAEENNSKSKKERLFDVLSVAAENQRKRESEETKQDQEPADKLIDSTTVESQVQALDEFGPYKSELNYLEDQILLLDKESALISIKSKLKSPQDDEDLDDPDDHWNGMRRRKDDPSSEIKRQKQAEKLERSIQQLSHKIETKIAASRQEGGREFRLEQLCKALDLNEFEKRCILELVKSIIMPSRERHYRGRIEAGSRSAPVGYLIEAFCETLEDKMKVRSSFYKSSTLIKEGILTIGQNDFMSDLSQCRVELDRRLFDYVVGLDTEMSEVIDGSHLYLPDVDLDDVIMPLDTKQRVVDAIMNFDQVKETYHALEIDRKITYGLGQVFLFYGVPGTGKTMLANAVAKKLQKKVLLVNFPDLGSNTSGSIIKFIFREARIQRALLFFDECESLFLDRQRGGKSVTMLLSEMERFDGLCILATNRAHDLDEAMHRRVSLAIEFRKPDHILREEIWKTLRPPKVQLDEQEINFGLLAKKFELTGGLIKNAWLQSVGLMVQRDGDRVTQKDLMQAASEQVLGHLSLEDFDRRIVPTCGLESMVLSETLKEGLDSIVQNTKAQAVLHGQWGFDKIHRSTTGISALFTGRPGTGKTMAAEAVGFELGRPLLVVNVAELVSKWVGETGKNIKATFADAKKRDAVLVFDEAEGIFGQRSDNMSSSTTRHDTINVGLLLQSIEDFPGVCIAITNQKNAIDEAFFRRFRVVLNFDCPDVSAREEMWKLLVPKDCPVSSDVQYRDLARRFELCGGEMKNALLRAATNAALRSDTTNRVVTMNDLTQACEAEQQKMGKINGNSLNIYA